MLYTTPPQLCCATRGARLKTSLKVETHLRKLLYVSVCGINLERPRVLRGLYAFMKGKILMMILP